jgi:hypothetical protein
VRNREQYDTFERMHWSCFHYEFEHAGDPDVAAEIRSARRERSILIHPRSGTRVNSAELPIWVG